mmetsp:Transcript_14079/g.12432  ORF Transcript_14079/g.12432 Transcript_14079/m.12432 type:complete len:183 (+) Transcript_14079:346-894(+)
MVTNDRLRALYENEDRGYLIHLIVNKEPLAIIFPEEKLRVNLKQQTIDQAEIKMSQGNITPIFKNFENIIQGITQKNKIALGILNPRISSVSENHHKKLFAVVQVEISKNDKFSHVHLLLLKTISNFLSMAINKILGEKESIILEKQSMEILHNFRDITHLTHLPDIWQKVMTFIPKIFNCK